MKIKVEQFAAVTLVTHHVIFAPAVSLGNEGEIDTQSMYPWVLQNQNRIKFITKAYQTNG